MLARAGIDVSDTRAWRLERLRDTSPLVDALLTWRKAERIATTYGYSWLDDKVGADGRLRGGWTGSDGAAGRMTAQAGLHNMPAELRPAVVAEPGHVLVRADLGQIEPRVLAAVSGDPALTAATASDDLYAPVAAKLGVERADAKVAVLAAMYGQVSGTAGQALRDLQAAYPLAMRFLDDADQQGRSGDDVYTYGGRRVRMSSGGDSAAIAGRGRYARNAVIQGAAAELFKLWAVTVRARTAALNARIVLCLHDELLVHAPAEYGTAVAELIDRCLQEAASRWAPSSGVRFVADIDVVERWSDAH
jgi:DNA polymerase-1